MPSMLYVDTSALVMLYVAEADSRGVVARVREHGGALPRTALHELEFTNAVRLELHRGEMAAESARIVLERFDEHLGRAVYFRPAFDWSQVWTTAIGLSHRHSRALRTRWLDILHIATAQVLGASAFLTGDHRQAKLAVASGLILAG